MTEYMLKGKKDKIIEGLANVIADLKVSRSNFEESAIRGSLDSEGVFEEQPILPGPTITLRPVEGKQERYLLRVNGKGENHTGNVTKTTDLVEVYLKQYFVR